LANEVAKATQQWKRSTNDVERSRIDGQIQGLIADQQAVEEQLRTLETTSSSGSPLGRDWQVHLSRINFREAVAITQDLLLNCTEKCAALFLLPNSLQMGGKFCVSRMRQLLQDSTADFRHFPLECSATSQFSEQWFLDNLARYLKVEVRPPDHTQAALELIKIIGHSIRSGSVLFFEIRGWEFVQDYSEMLTWFVREFWVPLTKELRKVERRYSRVRVVILIIIDEELPQSALPPELCCTRSTFQVERILELPLENWTQDEIREWLELYSYLRLTTEEIGTLARVVYNSSQSGLPALVSEALSQRMAMENI
jgi:hypothetical protein